MHKGAVVTMRMRVLAVLVGVLLLGLPATPAAAGGYPSLGFGQGRQHLAPGERIHVRVRLLWPKVANTSRASASSAYHVYLQPGPGQFANHPQRAWPGPAEGAVRVPGKVVMRKGKPPWANLVRVFARVTIPDLDPGRYHAVLCTAGCERLAPDLWPTDVTVAANASEARLISRFDRHTQRTERLLAQLRGSVDRRIHHAAVTGVNTDSALRGDIDEANNEVRRLDAELDRLATARDRDLAALRRLGANAAAAGLALLALCAGLSVALWRAKRRPAPAAADDGWERPPERHLVGSRR